MEETEPQPSTSTRPPTESNPPSNPHTAPERTLPTTPFYSVEYPGYVLPTSVTRAVRNLGGQSSLDTAFKRTASKTDALVELTLRPGNPFAHPIPGDVVPTSNILLKVVKRKRRKIDGQADDGSIGEYTTEAVGVIPKTLRFRGMADFQYQPPADDPITQLRLAMERMDAEFLRKYKMPEEKEDYMVPDDRSKPSNHSAEDVDMNLDPQLMNESQEPSTSATGNDPEPVAGMRSNLRLFPPPIFSRQAVPLAYNFKANPASVITTSVDPETGEEKKRMINRMRWKGFGPACINFSDASVPDKPPQTTVEELHSERDKSILERLKELFEERAIWTRGSLYNQLTPGQTRDITNSKALLPLVCYVFQDGPWRDTLVRFGYDPRKELDARFYQRLYFRNANHPIARPSVITRRQDRNMANLQNKALEQSTEREEDRRASHIFDGQTITKETAAFQLCDITDPMLKDMIEDTSELRETCNERDGWYTTHGLERIKTVLRHKFFSLLEGHAPTDEECEALLVATEGTARSHTSRGKLKHGKHNMAKGALRPEDAAALRLRATLERNAKGLQGQWQ